MSAWLIEALATGSVEKVRPNMGAAGERINDARRHVRSARLLADDDTTLAIAACLNHAVDEAQVSFGHDCPGALRRSKGDSQRESRSPIVAPGGPQVIGRAWPGWVCR